MIIRLRSRDGLERIEVDEHATVAGLKLAIREKLNIPLEEMVLSTKQGLLTSKEPHSFKDMEDNSASLASVSVGHGAMVFMYYGFERHVEPVYKRSVLETRQFGPHMTMSDIINKQVRVERQEKSHAASLSFDNDAANVFQSYVQGALAFSIKRAGILYGTTDEEGNVRVEVVYEPDQEGSAEAVVLNRGTKEEEQAEFIASMLGLQKVGWIFNQSHKARDYIMSTQEIMQMAAIQDEMGKTSVTVLVTWEEPEGEPKGPGQVHFEAFQCSDICVKLQKEGWLKEGDTPNVTRFVNPKEPDVKDPVIVAGKDVGEADTDYFLVPMKILSHQGLFMTSFPVENRHLPQGRTELKSHLEKLKSKRYVERLTDFHLLLWLSKQPNLDSNDMTLICEAVKEQKPIMDYQLIIDSIAGIA